MIIVHKTDYTAKSSGGGDIVYCTFFMQTHMAALVLVILVTQLSHDVGRNGFLTCYHFVWALEHFFTPEFMYLYRFIEGVSTLQGENSKGSKAIK